MNLNDPNLRRLIDAYNTGVIRARTENRQHPFERSLHGARCGREGCRKGYAALVQQAERINNYRRGRRAEGNAS